MRVSGGRYAGIVVVWNGNSGIFKEKPWGKPRLTYRTRQVNMRRAERARTEGTSAVANTAVFRAFPLCPATKTRCDHQRTVCGPVDIARARGRAHLSHRHTANPRRVSRIAIAITIRLIAVSPVWNFFTSSFSDCVQVRSSRSTFTRE